MRSTAGAWTEARARPAPADQHTSMTPADRPRNTAMAVDGHSEGPQSYHSHEARTMGRSQPLCHGSSQQCIHVQSSSEEVC